MADKRLIPLGSDTASTPTEGMRKAMAAAEVGDEQRREDPTVNALCERVAALLGHEDALYLPSGVMCNLVGVKAHTSPGDVVFAESMSHIIRAESAGAALASGVLIEAIPTETGIFTAADFVAALEESRSAPYPYAAPARLVCLEQSHNFGGGTVWTLAETEAVVETAREKGLATHLDGARLFNATTALGADPKDFGRLFDSVWIDFSKGLGAPVGAALAGSKDFIAAARRFKHLFGGAMRQAGVIAAGALYALDHHVAGLSKDHENARRLARGLAGLPGIEVANPNPSTNMVFLLVDEKLGGASGLAEGLLTRGVSVSVVTGRIRMVTHLDVTSEDIETAIAAFTELTGG